LKKKIAKSEEICTKTSIIAEFDFFFSYGYFYEDLFTKKNQFSG